MGGGVSNAHRIKLGAMGCLDRRMRNQIWQLIEEAGQLYWLDFSHLNPNPSYKPDSYFSVFSIGIDILSFAWLSLAHALAL